VVDIQEVNSMVNGMPTELAPNTLVDDRYQIVTKLGDGGMGTVYLATDTRLHDRTVALKLLEASPVRDLSTRFEREIEALSRVVNPHVVQIFDEGHYSGRRYYIMEYISSNLRQRMDRRVFDWPQTAALLRQLAIGLSSLHQQNLIHRDLKPENVLVESFRMGYDFYKICDLGIAKMHDKTTMSVAGYIIGTVRYLAPEQMRSDVFGPVTEATDMYALGLIAYEMLTGDVPFHADEDIPPYQRCERDPPPPQIANPSCCVSEAEASIVMALLARSPHERIKSPEQLLRWLSTDHVEGVVDVTSQLAARQKSIRIGSDDFVTAIDVLYLDTTRFDQSVEVTTRGGQTFAFRVKHRKLWIQMSRPNQIFASGGRQWYEYPLQPADERMTLRWRHPEHRATINSSPGVVLPHSIARQFDVYGEGTARFSVLLTNDSQAWLIVSDDLQRPMLVVVV
jgi:serine/threonine protein kinase